MKNFTQLAVLVWLVFGSAKLQAQLAPQCQTCFTSQVVKAAKSSAQCTDYQLKVFYDGQCAHALSHITIAVPECAAVSNLSNDQNASQVLGFDPTTGLNGFEIVVPGFGQSSLKSFLISFTLCSNTSSCAALSCWSPIVAYKAGNCFELDTLKGLCTNLTAHLQQKNASCFNAVDGSLNVIVDDGTAPLQYLWSNGATTSSIQNLAAGNYSVDVTDATGAKVSLTATISQPSEISINTTVTNATCSGQTNGAIQTSVSGGTGSYAYQWNTGATSPSLDSLKAGTYAVTVTDSLGCTSQASVQVKNDKQISLSFTPQFPGCNQSNGSLSVAASGGTAPYKYLWSTKDTTFSISNLPAASYSVTAVDAEGCSVSSNFSLHENNTLRISYTVTPTSCVDDSTGAITVSITGGTQPYSYLWSNGATSKDLQGLLAGSYILTVKDSLGCQMSTRISVFRKTFQVTSQIKQPKCSGDTTGYIAVTPSGVPPFQYTWSTGATTDSLVNLSSGIYKVTITDSTGCSKLLSFTIASPPQLMATDSIRNISCGQFSVDLSVSGGVAPYQYAWSNGAVTQNLSDVSPGSYQVTITDANSCSTSKQIKIDSVAPLSCSINPVTQSPACLSSGNKIFTSVTGATLQWELTSSDGSWSIQSGASNDTLTYVAGNANSMVTFNLTVTNSGCSTTCSYQLTSCSSSSGGGGGSGGTNSENCGDCFHSAITKTSETESCVTYTVDISTDGNCRYDLSHVVVAIPCGQISSYSDSKGWPLVLGKDPTTGLTGLKVANASSFGKSVDSFTIVFTVCGTSDCANQLKNWNPVVAYKAGQCIAYDTLSVASASTFSVYPNPIRDSFSVDITPDQDDVATIDLFNPYGQKVGETISTNVTGAQKNTIKIDATQLPVNVYLYKVRTSKLSYYGRILKSN